MFFPTDQAVPDTAQAAASTPYDSVWANPEVPTKAADGLEAVMLAQDKLYVVLAVVLIIWIGLIVFVLRTDQRLRKLERSVETGIPEEPAEA
ncbi:MAG: CcmD family protein [Bacteroidetes bacterium]|jgi:CcmD family protein|nr:CcmD family protein [Bacteroidota bacterium]